jgi:hypothetical protein
MRRRYGKEDPAKSDRRVGIVLTIFGIAFLIALGGGAWWLRRQIPRIDEQTNCPSSGPSAVHMIMFDRSDPISGQQAQQIKQAIDGYKTVAPFGYRFDIYTFESDSGSVLKPVLEICSPGNPDDANPLIKNPQQLRKQYEEKFAAVLDRTVDDLLRVHTLPSSPIIESLRAAAITSFGGLSSQPIPLRVMMISDMVQHTSAVSHFKTEPDFGRLSKSPVWPTLRPALKGAEVNIFYLLRPSATRGGAQIQTRGHQAFWEQLIKASDGEVAEIRPI